MSGAVSGPIGFIGLGAMGWPMVCCLARSGFELVLLDAVRTRAENLAREVGATVAASAADVAARTATIITMLPTSAVVESVLDGPAGVLAGMKPGTVLVEMSSGSPVDTQRLAARVEAAGGTLVDAPVSGGVARARTGDLAIMFGGPPDVLEQLRPVLSAMGSSITRTGGVGSAHAMKALNNLASAGSFLIGIEALLIGKKFGLDPGVMVDVLNNSTGMSNSSQKKFRQFVLSRKFDSGFGLDLMVKDIGIALALASEVAAQVPLAEALRERWVDGQRELGQGRDHTELAIRAELLADTQLTP